MSLSMFRKISCCLLLKSILDTVIFFKNTTFNTADIILDDGDFIADTITVNGGTISLSYGDCDFKKASLSNTTIKSADGTFL